MQNRLTLIRTWMAGSGRLGESDPANPDSGRVGGAGRLQWSLADPGRERREQRERKGASGCLQWRRPAASLPELRRRRRRRGIRGVGRVGVVRSRSRATPVHPARLPGIRGSRPVPPPTRVAGRRPDPDPPDPDLTRAILPSMDPDQPVLNHEPKKQVTNIVSSLYCC
ncbi:hypothetical protein Taro_023958 [Colocasia esculenta]|uniref:Uncharacterized protein n=1 Tax=Colocasia esculenta TaxID=4460 RepID=A0A843V7W4_COLES|nr:hypothetical protein [Colocasia esculenta]